MQSFMMNPSNYSMRLLPWEKKASDCVADVAALSNCFDDSEEEEEFGFEGLVDPFSDTWDRGVKKLFGSTMSMMEIPKVPLYTDFITANNEVIPQQTNLVFFAQPAVEVAEGYVASKRNRVGGFCSRTDFWKKHLEHRQVNGIEKALLHLAVRIPDCFHPVDKREAHRDAAERLDRHGHGIGACFQYTTFWGEVAASFVVLADSRIVRLARSQGFHAVYALKDGLLQKVDAKYGIRGYKFTSVDNFTISQVVLLGFCKQLSPNPSDNVLLSLRYNEAPLRGRSKEELYGPVDS
jgi:hypothetical protein